LAAALQPALVLIPVTPVKTADIVSFARSVVASVAFVKTKLKEHSVQQ